MDEIYLVLKGCVALRSGVVPLDRQTGEGGLQLQGMTLFKSMAVYVQERLLSSWCWTPPGLLFVTNPVYNLWIEYLGVAKWRKASALLISETHLFSLSDMVGSSGIRESIQNRAATLPHQKEPTEMVWASD